MAVYHLSAKVISRGSGRSSIAAAAYRTADRLTNDRDGMTHDYSRRRGVEHVEIMAPDNAPDWMRDRSRLWNAVEAVEKRKDAQLAREIEVSLPRELTPQQRTELVRGFVREEFVARGMVADVAIHCPTASDGREQPHAHVMLTMREIIPNEGFGGKNRDWNKGEVLEGWRERWARHQNAALERAGLGERVDHRTLEAQRADALALANDNARSPRERQSAKERAEALDRAPQPKKGSAAVAIERRGEPSWRMERFRDVSRQNAERLDLKRELRELAEKLAELAREIAAKLAQAVKALDVSKAMNALKWAAGAGIDTAAWNSAPSPEKSRLNAFRDVSRDIEALRKDGLSPPLATEDQRKRLGDQVRRDLRDQAKHDPAGAWDQAKELKREFPSVCKDLPKEFARSVPPGEAKRIADHAPDTAREMRRMAAHHARSRSRGFGR